MGFPPFGGGNKALHYWDFPHSEKCMYILVLGFSSLVDGNADMPTGFFRSFYRSRNPPLWDFPHSEPPPYDRDFPLSEPPFDISLLRFLSLETQTLAYGQMNTFIYPYSAVGFPPPGRQLRCDVPYTEDNSAVGIDPMMEVPDLSLIHI